MIRQILYWLSAKFWETAVRLEPELTPRERMERVSGIKAAYTPPALTFLCAGCKTHKPVEKLCPAKASKLPQHCFECCCKYPIP